MWGQADAGSRLTRIPKASINRWRQASTSGPVSGDFSSPRSLASASRHCPVSIRLLACRRRSDTVQAILPRYDDVLCLALKLLIVGQAE